MTHAKYKNHGSTEIRMIEECSELIKELCKVDRFGWFNSHPDEPDVKNIDRVERELDDLMEVAGELRELIACLREKVERRAG